MDNFKTSMIHFSKHSAVDVTSYVQSVFDSVEGQKSDQTKIESKDYSGNLSKRMKIWQPQPLLEVKLRILELSYAICAKSC